MSFTAWLLNPTIRIISIAYRIVKEKTKKRNMVEINKK